MTVNNWDDSKILTKKDTSIDPKKKENTKIIFVWMEKYRMTLN